MEHLSGSSWKAIMSSNPRRTNSERSRSTSQTTADATPTLAAALQGIAAGPALDQIVQRAFERLGHRLPPGGLSTTWEGAQQLTASLTALGCYLETQVHADRALCRVLRVLQGNAVAMQLAGAEAPRLPEAVARASVLACLEMEPPVGS
jgi:hypothetical protein